MMYFFNIFALVLMFVGFLQLTTGLSCDVSQGEALECGNNVQQQDQCPKTCCFNKTVNPRCYFSEKDYGPIKHANGLCINVQGTQRLIWSRDCTSRNAFFLLSYDYPPYHVTTGKCILPSSLNLGDPGKNVELLLTGSRYCGGKVGRYQPIKNGNLDYFHTDTSYKNCIGGSSVVNNEWQPMDNENVFINEKVCDVNNSCKFNYVYERKIENGDDLNIECDESCSNWVIEMRSAEFGVLLKERGRNRKPYVISPMEKDCLSTSALSVAQNQCNGKKKCSFTVRKEDFLSRPSSCRETSTLLVYYTCKTPKSSLSCDVSGGKLLECGSNVQLQDQCPKTCCFNHTVNPPCYFNEKGYGPIKHANGLCINLQGTQRLIWSRDCTSRNTFFLLSYDYPPYHVTTGKCILPSNLNLPNPGRSVELFLTGSTYCGGQVGRYRPIKNGNLYYFFTDTPYYICIGGSSVVNNEWQPNNNEVVFINDKVCDVNNSCKFNYVYERKIKNEEDLNIQCDESCSNWVIEMRSAEFGVLLKERGRNRKPYEISSIEKDCLSTSALSVAQNQCNGKKKCSFTVRKEDFLSRPSICRETSTLLVYYTCKTPKSVIRTTQAMQIITSSKSGTISEAPSKKATTADHETVFKKENKCSASTKNNFYLVAGVAIGAVPLIVLIVVFLICRIRRKRNLGNMYAERVLYKKRTKDEKRLTVSIDKECVKQDFKKNQNVVTKSSKKVQSKSKPQASLRDSTYEELDLSKLNDNNDNHRSLNAYEENTTYQELDVAQMNKEDDYQALNANEGDTIYQEVDTRRMNEEDNDYMSMTAK